MLFVDIWFSVPNSSLHKFLFKYLHKFFSSCYASHKALLDTQDPPQECKGYFSSCESRSSTSNLWQEEACTLPIFKYFLHQGRWCVSLALFHQKLHRIWSICPCKAIWDLRSLTSRLPFSVISGMSGSLNSANSTFVTFNAASQANPGTLDCNTRQGRANNSQDRRFWTLHLHLQAGERLSWDDGHDNHLSS